MPIPAVASARIVKRMSLLLVRIRIIVVSSTTSSLYTQIQVDNENATEQHN